MPTYIVKRTITEERRIEAEDEGEAIELAERGEGELIALSVDEERAEEES